VTAAAPERLHVLVHSGARTARDADDWWGDPLTTALAAVSLGRHPPTMRSDAESALDRLQRWRSDGLVRPTTADATALALAARAGADLQRSDPDLAMAAADAWVALLARDRLDIPDLHLSLAAWALDGLLPDRAGEPWVALRQKLRNGREPRGVDEPLRHLTRALAAERFDGSTLVQDMLRTVAVSPSISDACVLLWLLTAAIDRLRVVLPETDNALLVLVERRAGLVERLVDSVDNQTLVAPDFATGDVRVPGAYLSPDEALLVDAAVASREEAAPWVTYEEARSLFGRDADAALKEATDVRSRGLRVAAALIAVLAAAAAAIVWLVGRELTWPETPTILAAMATAASFIAIAFGVARRDPRRVRGIARTAVFAITFALLAWVITLNALLPTPVIADVPGLLIATILSALVSLIPPAPPEGSAPGGTRA
jgi:hypothetical protein